MLCFGHSRTLRARDTHFDDGTIGLGKNDDTADDIVKTKSKPKVKDKAKRKSKKDSQLVLRLDKEERDAFVELCKDLDTSAAREIRRFIRSFMKEHEED